MSEQSTARVQYPGQSPDQLSYQTPQRRVAPIPFNLDGRQFNFYPPKRAGIILGILDSKDTGTIGATGAFFDWLGQGLSEDDNNFLVARLKDPNDDLDLDTIADIARDLMERASDTP